MVEYGGVRNDKMVEQDGGVCRIWRKMVENGGERWWNMWDEV